jgi:hypothetical protein
MSGAGGLGAGSHGSLPWGSGFGLAVESMRVVRLNAVDVTFAGIPKSFDRAAPDDALNPKNYELTRAPAGPFDSSLPLVQTVEERSQSVMRVFFDAPLQAEASYVLTVSSSVESLTGIPMSPACAFATIVGLIEGATPRMLGIEEQRTDVANVPASATELAGTFQIGPTGDLANHGGVAYLRKRIIRRITTARGGFFHLPDYGFSEGLKQRLTPALLGRLRSQSEAQIKSEPDVLGARVDVTRLSLSVILVTIRVRTVSGNFTINEQLDFGETV